MAFPDFNPIDFDSFRARCPRFASELDAVDYDFVAALNCAEAFYEMRAVSDSLGYPALAGVLHRIYTPLKAVPDDRRSGVKQALGSLACEIMESNGYSKTGTKRNVPPVPERMFQKTEVYVPRQA